MSKLILRLLVLMTLVLSQRGFSFGDDFLHRSQQGISKIEVSDAAFPATRVNAKSEPITVIVKNMGNSSLAITSFVGPSISAFTTDLADFQISQDNPVFLGPNKELRFQMWFTPDSERSFSDSIVFESDAGFWRDAVCLITGDGVTPKITVNDAGFARLPINKGIDSAYISVMNTGTSSLSITGFSGPNDNAFTTDLANYSLSIANPKILQPSTEFKFMVWFAPLEEKVYLDSIVFQTDARGNDPVCLLTGEGWDDISAPEISTASLDSRILPNPLDSRGGQIEFDNPNDGTVEIALFNSLNQQVAVLQSGWMKAGKQTIRIPIEELPSGAYSFRIVIGNRSESGKFIIEK